LRIYRTFGITLLTVGILLLVIGFAYPLVTLIIEQGVWAKPYGFSDPDNVWTNEPNAYDGVLTTRAYIEVPSGGALNPTWSSFLILTTSSMTSNKLRYYLDYGSYGSNWVDVDVLMGSIWIDVYEGSFSGRTWVERSFTQGTVTGIRMRFQNTLSQIIGHYINEVEIWQLSPEPPTDDTPPVYRQLHPFTTTGLSLGELVAYVKDPESGIQSVICDIAGTTHSLTFVASDAIFSDEKWYKDITDITASGEYTFTWVITNKVGLKTEVTGIYRVYTALQGKWYLNDIEITSPIQTVYSTNLMVSFKFVKTAGIEDSNIVCMVWREGDKILVLQNTAVSTWTGSYTFTEGKYTLLLKAFDGTTNVIMSILDANVGGGMIGLSLYDVIKIFGAIMVTAGLVFTAYPFKNYKGG